jgi:serine O-acetyltransferase
VIREDIRAGLDRDPSVKTGFELFFTSPGLHAVWVYRIAHVLWKWKRRILARILSNYAKFFSGIEIHPGATIGRRLVIYHGVTLGGKTLDPVKRHPTVGNRVILGAGSKLIGNIVIGDDCRVGANAVVTKNMPAGTVAVGVNAKLIRSIAEDHYAI